MDYGERRIGLATSDETASLAFPAGFLERKGNRHDLDALRRIVSERRIERVVIGLPLHLDGREGEAAGAARAFAGRIERELGLPVETVDERFSTVEAERALREQGIQGRRGRRRRREAVDATAATLLLRSWLERRAGGVR
jgi:putative Holliday junction resolvase